MARVLLVDDEPALLFTLSRLLKSRGLEPVLAHSGKEALAKLDGVDGVVTDYSMPDMDGVQLVQAVRERDDSLPVVMLTAHGSERIAVRAMKSGAYEYVTKPFDIDEISRLLESVNRVAPKDITVLIRGDTGTGKELIASLIHAESRRAAGPLVRFNCAAIPGELAESELFGHSRGAFTGATQARRGFFAEANGGTLVLDEVGELSGPIQAKLLRALQEGEIQPVGAGRVEKVDVRVVACTNRDLVAEVRAHRFREDLYYRLAVVELIVPPLNEHRDDVPALATEFARRYAERFGMQDVRLAPELVQALRRADWPGNVRQLENSIARMVALGGGGEIGLQAFTGASSRIAEPGAEPPPDGTLSLREQLEALERSVIARTLASVAGNQSEAARRLGLSRGSLIDRLKKYGFAASATDSTA